MWNSDTLTYTQQNPANIWDQYSSTIWYTVTWITPTSLHLNPQTSTSAHLAPPVDQSSHSPSKAFATPRSWSPGSWKQREDATAWLPGCWSHRFFWANKNVLKDKLNLKWRNNIHLTTIFSDTYSNLGYRTEVAKKHRRFEKGVVLILLAKKWLLEFIWIYVEFNYRMICLIYFSKESDM